MSELDHRPVILVVDDEPTNLQILRQVLHEQYTLLFATDGVRALDLARKEQPELILLDVMMPGMDGYSVCEALKAESLTANIPVIFVTALNDAADEARGFEVGCVDFITKPISAAVVKARVRTHLSLVHMDELRRTRLKIVQRLGRAAEYKDNETGMHVIRMSHYARTLALAAGCTPAWAEDLLNAAPMHDVGKLGIPDAILQKPGKLDAEEWAIMQTHPRIGAEIIGEDDSQVLKLAYSAALHHHEKYDGSGYPDGLKGEEIPLEARIVAIADVFDALTSERPYKKAWPVEEAFALIEAEAGKHFDPVLAPLFVSLQDQILSIKRRWGDE